MENIIVNKKSIDQKIRSAILQTCKDKKDLKNIEECILKLKAILDTIMLGNKFVTIYNFEEKNLILLTD